MHNGSCNECNVEELLLTDLLIKATSMSGELGPSELESCHSDINRHSPKMGRVQLPWSDFKVSVKVIKGLEKGHKHMD